MRYAFAEKIRRSRTVSSLAVLVVFVGIALSSGAAQGRVDPLQSGSTSSMNQDTIAKATGGGTVLMRPTSPGSVASFGVNARRPDGFPGGGEAEGRINYVRHRNMPDRHVNVPVVYMEAGVTPQPPNMTGGDAVIIGDCAGATCPATAGSVMVYVKDVSDSGAGQDVFEIYFCPGGPTPPTGFVPRLPFGDCTGPEGDTLRSGNIQVRGDAPVVGEQNATGAGSGAYTSTPNVNGVELAGGTFGVALRTAGPGDLEAQLNGVSPLIGLFQQVTVTGWITSSSVSGGTMSFSGTAKLDMGDGGAPLTGLALSGSVTATGLTLTVGGWSFGTLPKADGFITIE
jgi:hypothetical protein